MSRNEPRIRRIELRRGLLERGASPERLPVQVLLGRHITGAMIDAVEREGLLDLDGVYGLPEAGDPAQYDSLKFVLADRTVEITVYNLAIGLFRTDDEIFPSVQRVIGMLEKAIAGGGEVPPLPLVRAEPRTGTGRNDPCPCGSGKKYKKCCLDADAAAGRRGASADLADEIGEELERGGFESLEEAEAAAEKVVQRRNRKPLEEFGGLSPERMFRLMHFPFDSPGLISFPGDYTVPRKAPMIFLFDLLAGAAGGEGLHATARGNLGQKFSKEAYRRFADAGLTDSFSEFNSVHREEDFLALHLLRLVAVQAGLLRRAKGRFHLTARGREAAGDPTGRLACFALFRACTLKVNWAYFDGYPAFEIVQAAVFFTLYLLQLHGGEFRPHEFYGDLFVKAFPRALDECPSGGYFTPRETLISCHAVRSFERFAAFFGLAEIRVDEAWRHRGFQVRKTPLLDGFITFHV